MTFKPSDSQRLMEIRSHLLWLENNNMHIMPNLAFYGRKKLLFNYIKDEGFLTNDNKLTIYGKDAIIRLGNVIDGMN